MRLRARLAVATLAVSVPMVAALIGWEGVSRSREAASTLADFTRAGIGSPGWRARCEAAPDFWTAEGVPEAQRAPRTLPPPPMGGSLRQHSLPAVFFFYDEHLVARHPNAPKLAPDLLEAIEHRDFVPVGPFAWGSRTVEVLVRAPGESGACAFVLARGTTEPWLGVVLPPTQIWLLPLLGVFVTVLLAVGPLIRRIRRLIDDVRRSASAGYQNAVVVEGNDEIADLARAFEAAARDVRVQLSERERREQALREFLSNTTHDVMIPLTVLQGHLTHLKDQASSEWPAAASTVAAAMDEAHYLGSLVHNLAIAAKLDSNQPEVHRAPVDLNALVGRVVARHRPIARQLAIEFDCALPNESLVAQGDVTLLEQAVSNVVYNSIRHNRSGGHSAVILERAGERRFRVRVLDDGPGIPADELGRLLERGFRGTEARTRTPEGRGIGLNIAHRVAQVHQMKLELRASEYGGLEVELDGACDAA